MVAVASVCSVNIRKVAMVAVASVCSVNIRRVAMVAVAVASVLCRKSCFT